MGEIETNQLLKQARAGNLPAVEQLLEKYRGRLRRMVACRMDPRVLARVDASDVVQDALIEANQKLPEYLRACPISLYGWLRGIALQKLVRVHEKHVCAAKRSVKRERARRMRLPDHSSLLLVERLQAQESSPSRAVVSDELMRNVRATLDRLPEQDHEILVMRYLERLSIKEVAEILSISLSAAKMRQARALERIKTLLRDESGSV